jgi:hypothetical protein
LTSEDEDLDGAVGREGEKKKRGKRGEKRKTKKNGGVRSDRTETKRTISLVYGTVMRRSTEETENLKESSKEVTDRQKATRRSTTNEMKEAKRQNDNERRLREKSTQPVKWNRPRYNSRTGTGRARGS